MPSNVNQPMTLPHLKTKLEDFQLATVDDETGILYLISNDTSCTLQVIQVDPIDKNIERSKYTTHLPNYIQRVSRTWNTEALLCYKQKLYLVYETNPSETGDHRRTSKKVATLNVAHIKSPQFRCTWTHQKSLTKLLYSKDYNNKKHRFKIASLLVHKNHMIFLAVLNRETVQTYEPSMYFLIHNFETGIRKIRTFEIEYEHLIDHTQINEPRFGPSILNDSTLILVVAESLTSIVLVNLDELITLPHTSTREYKKVHIKQRDLRIQRPYIVSSGDILLLYSTNSNCEQMCIIEKYDKQLCVTSKFDVNGDNYKFNGLILDNPMPIDAIIYIPTCSCFLVLMSDNNNAHNKLIILDDIDAKIGQKNRKTLLKNKNKYEIGTKIGSGATSVVYNAVLNERQLVNVKFRKQANLDPYQVVIVKQQSQMMVSGPENNSHGHSGMVQERKILEKIRGNKYVCNLSCRLIDYFIEKGLYHLVLTKLGPTLQHFFNLNGNRFSASQVCGMMSNMISILYKLHAIGFVHNDIKPENIVIGNYSSNNETNDTSKLYLIDFGLAKPFWDFATNKHVSQQVNFPFEGTFRFSSLNHHCHAMKQSRRDDLESLIYVGLYFLNRQSLPWNNVDISGPNRESELNLLNQTKQIKLNASIDEICNDISMDVQKPFLEGLNYVRQLKFEETPDYVYLQSLFQTLLEQQPQITDLYTRQHKKNKSTVGKKRIRRKLIIPDYSTMNNKIISKYIKNIPLQSDRTQVQNQTYYSAQGLVNRSDCLIKSIVVHKNDHGIPSTFPKENEKYGGMIIYQQNVKSRDLEGVIYLLELSMCNAKNREYQEKHNKRFPSQCHDAIYYNYFGAKATSKKDRDHNKEFIRGFFVNGRKEKGVEYKFVSGAFNLTNLQMKIQDRKYRELAPSEKLFIQYSLNKYWEYSNKCDNRNDFVVTLSEFEEYQNCKSLSGVSANLLMTISEDKDDNEHKQEKEETDAKLQQTQVGDVPGYAVHTLQILEAKVSSTKKESFKAWKCDKKFEVLKRIGSRTLIVKINDKNVDGLKFEKQHNLAKNETIVIKQAHSKFDNGTDSLMNEHSILKKIHNYYTNCNWTYTLLDTFVENHIPHLVVSKLGLSLHQLFLKNNYKFSLLQTLLIFKEMFIILYKLHSIGIVHNDMRLENVLTDIRENVSNSNINHSHFKLFLIDFGISKIFWDFANNRHVDKIQQQWDEKEENIDNIPFEGTFSFSALDHHCNRIENKSRKHDIESLLYMCIYLIKNDLPWVTKYPSHKDKKLYLETQKLKKKASIENDICSKVPKQFEIALKYVRNLKFDQCPDYQYLLSLFDQLIQPMPTITTNNATESFIGSRAAVTTSQAQRAVIELCGQSEPINTPISMKCCLPREMTTTLPGYSKEAINEMLRIYARVILPYECIFSILSFLSFQDEISISKCCQISKQLINYYRFKKCCSLLKNDDCVNVCIVNVCIVNVPNRTNNEDCIELTHKRVEISKIDQSKINFTNWSYNNNCFILLDHDKYGNYIDMRTKSSIFSAVEKVVATERIKNTLRNRDCDSKEQSPTITNNRVVTVRKFVWKQLECEEEQEQQRLQADESDSKASVHHNVKNYWNSLNFDGSIAWYWKISDRDINAWQQYDIQTQIQIENAYNDAAKSMIVLDQGPIYSDKNNDKFYKKYAILFEAECQKARITRCPKLYHSISNKKWTKQVFVKYFYQRHLIHRRYRLVKRVECAKEQYVRCMIEMDENYF